MHSNAAPILNPIGPRTVDENQQLSFVVTTSDIDGQIPALQALNLPANAAFTDSLNGHALFVFIPSYFQSGSYNVQFIASDGSLADSENVAITVNNINRSPVLNPIGNRTVIEGGSISFRVISSDSDLHDPFAGRAKPADKRQFHRFS